MCLRAAASSASSSVFMAQAPQCRGCRILFPIAVNAEDVHITKMILSYCSECRRVGLGTPSRRDAYLAFPKLLQLLESRSSWFEEVAASAAAESVFHREAFRGFYFWLWEGFFVRIMRLGLCSELSVAPRRLCGLRWKS